MSGWSELAHLLKAFTADLESAMKRGHSVGHSKVDEDARNMAADVTATENKVASEVPAGVPASPPNPVPAPGAVPTGGGVSPAPTPSPKGPPKPSPNFLPPTNPPQLPPAVPLPGHHVRQMGPTAQYPHGYWVETNAVGQPVNPSTGKPPANVTKAQSRAQTHVPFPMPNDGTN